MHAYKYIHIYIYIHTYIHTYTPILCPGMSMSQFSACCTLNGQTLQLRWRHHRPGSRWWNGPGGFPNGSGPASKTPVIGLLHAKHRKMWQRKKSWGLKRGQKLWINGGRDFIGTEWDQMTNWQTLMGMSSMKPFVMFCSLLIAWMWKT